MFPRSYKNQEDVKKVFVLNVTKEHLRYYNKIRQVLLLHLKLKNVTEPKVLSQLMLKFQRKTCHFLLKRISLKRKTTAYYECNAAKFYLIGLGVQSKKNMIKFLMQLLKFCSSCA